MSVLGRLFGKQGNSALPSSKLGVQEWRDWFKHVYMLDGLSRPFHQFNTPAGVAYAPNTPGVNHPAYVANFVTDLNPPYAHSGVGHEPYTTLSSQILDLDGIIAPIGS